MEAWSLNYWIVALPREDMEHCISVGTIGLNSKQSMGSIEPGDQIVCCATKEKPWKILGLGEATSSFYVDDKPIFKKSGGFWYRFDFKILAKQLEADFQVLVEDFSFVTNPAYWPVYFKGSIKRITKDDWAMIKSHCHSEDSSDT